MGGERSACHLLYAQTVGALCQDDYKGPNRQYVVQGKLIVEVIHDISEDNGAVDG